MVAGFTGDCPVSENKSPWATIIESGIINGRSSRSSHSSSSARSITSLATTVSVRQTATCLAPGSIEVSMAGIRPWMESGENEGLRDRNVACDDDLPGCFFRHVRRVPLGPGDSWPMTSFLQRRERKTRRRVGKRPLAAPQALRLALITAVLAPPTCCSDWTLFAGSLPYHHPPQSVGRPTTLRTPDVGPPGGR